MTSRETTIDNSVGFVLDKAIVSPFESLRITDLNRTNLKYVGETDRLLREKTRKTLTKVKTFIKFGKGFKIHK